MIPDLHIENTAIAHAIIEGVPQERIHLNRFDVLNPADLTQGPPVCVFAWLMHHPYFRAQGLRQYAREVPLRSYVHLWAQPVLWPTGDFRAVGPHDAAGALFGTTPDGEHPWAILFRPYGDGHLDSPFLSADPAMTHKTLALERFKEHYRLLQASLAPAAVSLTEGN